MAEDNRPPNIWFIAAWVLLVVVVAFGFYVQARTINELHNTQDAIRNGVVQNRETMCKLMLIVTEAASEERTAALEMFESVGIDCIAP